MLATILFISSESLCLCISSLETKVKIYKTIILPAVLYGCKVWCLTLREEYRLKVYENMVLRRILHNEELHNMYTFSNIVRVIKSRKMRWSGHVACMGEMRNAYNILVGKHEMKKPLGRPRCR
jgi:hypothetical protein